MITNNLNDIPRKTVNPFKAEFTSSMDGVIIPHISEIGRQSYNPAINRDNSGLPEDEFVARCNQYGISENGKAHLIEPDLLGEYYVLRYAERLGGVMLLQDFWQRLFRDNYRLINTKYKSAFEWLLRISAHLIYFYYKGLFEAFLNSGDLSERKYIRILMEDVFAHLGD